MWHSKIQTGHTYAKRTDARLVLVQNAVQGVQTCASNILSILIITFKLQTPAKSTLFTRIRLLRQVCAHLEELIRDEVQLKGALPDPAWE
jgi:hypothetical protein